MLPGRPPLAVPPSLRIAWAPVPRDVPRREVAWGLVRGLAPGAELSNPCPVCGGAHGPVRIEGAAFAASVAYAGALALVAVVGSGEAGAVGLDAELAVDPARDAVGLGGVLGPDRPADVRAWTRVEAALKADGRGLRVDPALVRVEQSTAGWTARVPGRPVALPGSDLEGPADVLVSVAWRPAT